MSGQLVNIVKIRGASTRIIFDMWTIIGVIFDDGRFLHVGLSLIGGLFGKRMRISSGWIAFLFVSHDRIAACIFFCIIILASVSIGLWFISAFSCLCPTLCVLCGMMRRRW